MSDYLRDKIAEAYRAASGEPIFPPALDAITATALWFAADELDDAADSGVRDPIRYEIRARAATLRKGNE